MAKRQPATPAPTEVSVNLDSMRNQVMRGFIDANRATLKVFDDIDAAERVLRAHASGTFPHELLAYHAGGGAPQLVQAIAHRNGNRKQGQGGKLGRPRLQIHGEVEEVREVERRPSKGGQGAHVHPKGTGLAITTHAIETLKAMPPGSILTTISIFESAVAAGVLPPGKVTLKLRQFIAGTMRIARRQGLVDVTHVGKGPAKHAEYFLPQRRDARSVPDSLPTPEGPRIPVETPLREAVIEVLARHKSEMTMREIANMLIAHGWPVKRGSGMLADHITQMMIFLRRKRIVKSSKNAQGVQHHRLLRPTAVRIEKH